MYPSQQRRPAEADVYSRIYEAIDHAATYVEGVAPPGTHGVLMAGVDRLRMEAAETAMIARAETACLLVHKLQWARLSSRDAEIATLRVELDSLAADWIANAPVRASA